MTGPLLITYEVVGGRLEFSTTFQLAMVPSGPTQLSYRAKGMQRWWHRTVCQLLYVGHFRQTVAYYQPPSKIKTLPLIIKPVEEVNLSFTALRWGVATSTLL